MSTLEKWLPFKFFRKSKDEGRAEVQPAGSRTLPAAASADPWRSMVALMDAMMRDPFGFPDPFAGPLDRWFGDFSPARFGVTADVVDEGDALRVDFELPGMTKEDITLTIEGGTLVLRGEKRRDSSRTEDGVYRSERYFGVVQRVVPLPRDLDFDAAEATFKDGVLAVRLPKERKTSGDARTVPIQSA